MLENKMTSVEEMGQAPLAPADDVLFTVTDLKQYSFCPRVFYYEHCLPHIRPRTHKMDIGHEEHEAEQKRAERRTLRQYGIIDEVVYTEDGRLLPVDYKLAPKVSANHRLQLAAYAMLLEDRAGTAVKEGYIYLIGKRSITSVDITPTLREQIRGLLGAMFETLRWERMPEPTTVPNRCAGCEFRRFCNDV
jgi:CRISPR-associated exonuclease Cas4